MYCFINLNSIIFLREESWSSIIAIHMSIHYLLEYNQPVIPSLDKRKMGTSTFRSKLITRLYKYHISAISRPNPQDKKRIVTHAKLHHWRGSNDLLQVHENRPI